MHLNLHREKFTKTIQGQEKKDKLYLIIFNLVNYIFLVLSEPKNQYKFHISY